MTEFPNKHETRKRKPLAQPERPSSFGFRICFEFPHSSFEFLTRSTVLFFLLWTFALSAFSADDTNWFPILPWNNPPADPAVLKKIHDCGFTLAGFVPPSALNLCRAAGLKAIVSDPRVSDYDWVSVNETKARSNVSNLVAQVGSDPTVFGYYLRDEPPAGYFGGLAKVAGAVRDFAPGKWPYIN